MKTHPEYIPDSDCHVTSDFEAESSLLLNRKLAIIETAHDTGAIKTNPNLVALQSCINN